MKKFSKKLTYKNSGVDIQKADQLIATLSKQKSEKSKNILSDIGGFSSLYSVDLKKYKNPVIVCGTDGVGTKLKIANSLNQHNFIGQDLLAMCVNDVITCGADPVLFLDYLATSKINLNLHKKVLLGIKKACKAISVPLLGGETAEMPGFYKNNEYDLAGFCVGLVDKKNIFDNSKVKKGDVIIGVKSSGLHSNGYSLINKLLDNKILSLNKTYRGIQLGKALIKPTVIYSSLISELKKEIKACAHITGGGITGNVPRVLPENLTAFIRCNSWKRDKIFDIVQEKANLDDSEMLKTFNCGIGMVIIAHKKNLKSILNKCKSLKSKVYQIGEITTYQGISVIYD